MIPQITDATLARFVQNVRMVAAGRDYWRRGLVWNLQLNHEPGDVRASVKGSAAAPYQVELRFLSASGGIANCTCPVGIGCKHVAATLFAIQGHQGGHPVESLLPQLTLPAAVPFKTPPPALDILPPVLSQWAAAMRPLAEQVSGAATARSRAIFYIVRVQSPAASTRLSKKRPLTSLAPPGCGLRLFIEVVEVVIDASGDPVDSGAKVQSSGLYGYASGPAHMADEDRLLIRRLQTRIGDTDHEGCLAGIGGGDLFDRILATGRARWASVRGPLLYRETPVRTQLVWMDDDLGRTMLTVAGMAPEHAIGLVTPPVSIDTLTGEVVSLDLGVPPAMAEQLLRLPPIGPDAVEALAARWPTLVPANVPAPTVPKIVDLGVLSPVPVLTLRMDQVSIEERYGSRYRYAKKVRVDSAVARVVFDYAGTIIDATTEAYSMLVRDDRGLVRFTRDEEAEFNYLTQLLYIGLPPADGFEGVHTTLRQGWDHAPEMPAQAEEFVPFLIYDAETLRSQGWRVEVASDFPLTVVAAETDDLSVDVIPSGIDWFDIGLGVTIDGERIDLVPALRRLLARLDSIELEQIEHELAEAGDLLPVAVGKGKVVTFDVVQVMPVLRALLLLATNNPTVEGVAPRPGFSSLDLGLLEAIEAVTPNLPWSGLDQLRLLARELTQLKLDPTPLPAGFGATLRPYQQTGFDWLEALARAGLGGMLADDMGLGKTVQTLAHIASQKASGTLDKPVLIIAPTSVLPNWESEAARFAPGLSVLLLHGPDRHVRHETITGHDLVLTSYPLLARDEAVLARETFGLVVFDEAHTLKNPQTAGHRAARKLAADRKIALTGTPVENRLTDAWALFDLIVPGLLGNQRAFARDYRNPIEKHADVDARARLVRKLRPFLLRRTKDAVAVDLPPKSVVPLAITLGSAQMALHESQRMLMQQRVRDEIARVGLMRAQIVVLTALTRLRQVCCDPRLLPGQGSKSPASAKLERLLEMIDEMIVEGRRIILFSQFTSMLDLIKSELDSRHHQWVELTGNTKDRKTPIARFQAGEVPLILVSLKAGGTGLNLTAADTVILYDPWWNPAVEAQAIDRAHRIGQHKPVFVYRMIATGTIEEKIVALQERKSALADALWSEDVASPAHLTEDDIAFLLG